MDTPASSLSGIAALDTVAGERGGFDRPAIAQHPGRARRNGMTTPSNGRRAYVVGYLYLVASNAGAKVAGLVREILVAGLFGASPGLGLYVVLKSGVDALSVTATGAFQLSLVPRLARAARADAAGVDDRALFADALRAGLWATLISVLGMAAAVTVLAPTTTNAAALVAILSLSVGLLLVGVVGLIGHQAKGQFGRVSAMYLLTAVLMAVLVYPLGRWLGVAGLALTWLVSVTVQATVVWWPTARSRHVDRETEEPGGSFLGWADLRPGVLIAGNQMVLCLIAMKLLATWDGLRSVAVVNYALVLAGLFVTTIAKTMSSVVLKAATDGLSWRRLLHAVGAQIAASAGIYLALVLAGEPAIRFLFERGSFDAGSTEAVHRFLLQAFPALALLGSLDLLIVYSNGRELRVASRLYSIVGALMVGAIGAACVYALVGPDAGRAPIVFVSTFAVTALAASAVLVWRARDPGAP